MRHSKTGLPDMSDSKMSTFLNLVTGSSGCAQPLEFTLTSNEFKSGLSTLIIRGVPSNLRFPNRWVSFVNQQQIRDAHKNCQFREFRIKYCLQLLEIN